MGVGNGPIAAFINAIAAIDINVSVMDYVEHTMTASTDAMAASYVECEIGDEADTHGDLGRRHRFLDYHPAR